VKEFSFARYLCRGDGNFTDISGIVTNAFNVLCRLNASYDPAPLWPTCIIQNCLTVPTALGNFGIHLPYKTHSNKMDFAGLTPSRPAPVPINTGSSIFYISITDFTYRDTFHI